VRLGIFDFDGTLVAGDSFLRFSYSAADNPAQLTWAFAQAVWLKVGLLNNLAYKRRVVASLWTNKSSKAQEVVLNDLQGYAMKNAYQEVVDQLIQYDQTKDVAVVVSASPEFYLRPIIRRWTPNAQVRGARFQFDESGVQARGMHGEAKARFIQSLIRTHQPDETWVYTDHIADLPLVDLADRAFLVHPSRAFRAAVDETQTPYTVLRP